jgi:hypothetical protein
MTTRSGIVVRAGGEFGFVPADVARQVVPLPTLSPVASAPLEMAVVGGQIVPVVALGSPTGSLLVCEVDGETVGFSGLEVHRVGTFDGVDGGVIIDLRTVRDLELSQLLRSLEQALEPRIGESS